MDKEFREALQAKLEGLTSHLEFWNKGENKRTAPAVVCTAYAPCEDIGLMDREVPYISFSSLRRTTTRKTKKMVVKLHLVVEADPRLAMQEQWDGGHDDIDAVVSAVEDHLYRTPQYYGRFKLSAESGVESTIGSRSSQNEGMPAFPYFYAEIKLYFVAQ